MDKGRPIGVFDSGLGGLTVVKEIKKILPHEDLIYLGDTARLPYGTRSGETVIKFSFQDARFLLKKKVKCIVVACNTASAYAGSRLERKIKIPVFGVVTPAIKKARSFSKKGKIAVIGTRGTIISGAYQFLGIACPLLVPLIEEGEVKGKLITQVAERYLRPLKKKRIGVLILGCTHYPLIEKIIQRVVGKGVSLINPEEEVVAELKNYLTKNKLLNQSKDPGKARYYVTDLTPNFQRVAEMFLGEKLEGRIKKVSIE
jgi:glutamate racemase